jgi:hypothetical protein
MRHARRATELPRLAADAVHMAKELYRAAVVLEQARSAKILERRMISDRCRYDGRSTMRDRFHWGRLLAFATGLVNQDLLLEG